MADKRPIETIDGLVNEKDKPLWRRIYDLIFAENLEDVKRSVLKDIVGPYIKDFFYDVFTGSIERSIYGSSRSNYSVRNSASRAPLRPGASRASYESYYKNRSTQTNDELYEPVVMESRAKAEKLIDILRARIGQYGNTTINELNDCLKRIGKFTDEYYGWNDLSSASIRKISLNEYEVILPEPIQLNKKEKTYVEL